MIRCKTCDAGELLRKKKYRMSGIVVLIGYILLIPSVFGVLAAGLMLFGAGTTAVTAPSIDTIKAKARAKLEAAGISNAITTQVLESHALSEADRQALTPSQRTVIDDVELEFFASRVTGAGATVAGGLSIFGLVCSLVGGLLGWLLVMKKLVLQCTRCGAVTAAS